MFGLFKKEEFKIVAPVDGELIPLAEVADGVFSEKIMGDGFAVIPANGAVCAPLSGTAETVFPTGHAVGIKSKDGIECIIHIGLETVELIVNFDKEALEQKGYKLTTMVVFPSGYEHVFDLGKRTVASGETLVS